MKRGFKKNYYTKSKGTQRRKFGKYGKRRGRKTQQVRIHRGGQRL